MVDAQDAVYVLSADGDVRRLGAAKWSRPEWRTRCRCERSGVGDIDGFECECGDEYTGYFK